MELNERRKQVLSAIVETYIQTGEPVGSKLLCNQLVFQVSSATVRSDMAWLFERGYLEQPHTSAGRVPSHLGYRFYIDSLMRCKPLTQEECDEIDSLFNVKNPDPDKLLEDAAEALSDYTQCATVTSSITPKTVRVRQVEIIGAGQGTVVILIIATNGVIKNKVCRVDFVVTPELLSFFNKFSTARLVGRSLDSITSQYISSVSITLGEYSRIFTPLLVSIYELCREINEGQYYISGGTKLLRYSELDQLVRDMLLLLEKRELMQTLFYPTAKDFQILIGKENNSMELSGASVVSTQYNVKDEAAGMVGIIGPVRMEYAKIIPHLEYFAKTLGELLSDTFEVEE